MSAELMSLFSEVPGFVNRYFGGVGGGDFAVRVDLDETTRWFCWERGVCELREESPAMPVAVAIAATADDLGALIRVMSPDGSLELPQPEPGQADAQANAIAARSRLEQAFADQALAVTVVLEHDQRAHSVSIGIGRDAREQADFSVHVGANELGQLTSGAATLPELFLAGRIRLEGNYGPALQLAMQLMPPS